MSNGDDIVAFRRLLSQLTAELAFAQKQRLAQNGISFLGCSFLPVRYPDKVIIPAGVRAERWSHHPLAGFVALGAFSFTASGSLVRPDICIGRYCSVAENVSIMGAAHPMAWASTSLVFFDPPWMLQEKIDVLAGRSFYPMYGVVDVGHDVWIGEEVKLKGGIRIGDGAVIAARSVVTRDVPPYAVVGGVPARVLKMRFADKLAERLLSAEWWRFHPKDLGRLSIQDPLRFVDEFEATDKSAWQPLSDETLDINIAGKACACPL